MAVLKTIITYEDIHSIVKEYSDNTLSILNTENMFEKIIVVKNFKLSEEKLKKCLETHKNNLKHIKIYDYFIKLNLKSKYVYFNFE